MPKSFPRLGFMSLLISAQTILACGAAHTPKNALATVVPVYSTQKFYEGLMTLPKTGSASISALLNRVGGMSFTQYHRYALSMAPDSDVMIDGQLVANPQRSLAASEDSFVVLGILFPTVNDYWSATGRKPQASYSYADYKAIMDRIFAAPNSPKLGLLGVGSQLPQRVCYLATYARVAYSVLRTMFPTDVQRLNQAITLPSALHRQNDAAIQSGNRNALAAAANFALGTSGLHGYNDLRERSQQAVQANQMSQDTFDSVFQSGSSGNAVASYTGDQAGAADPTQDAGTCPKGDDNPDL